MTAVEAPYDAEVEYLESTGTQWIDTGVLPDNNTQTDIDFMVLRNNTAYDCVAACEGNSVYYWVCARNGNTDRYMLNTSNSGAVYVSHAFNVRHRVQFNTSGNKLLLDGVAYQLGSVAKRCNTTIGLWAEHLPSYTAYFSIAKIYSVVIIDRSTGVTLRDLIPVRFTNELGQSEGAMYDKVSGQLFRNQGTGSFAVGPDVRPYSTPVMGLHFMRDMGGMTARDYVQDGLIAMWDGIENAGWGTHDAAATTWRNLMGGGYDFSLTARGSFGPDSLICAGTGSACGFADRLSSFVSMEAVLRWDTAISGVYQMAFAVANNGKAIMHYSDRSKDYLAFNSYYQIRFDLGVENLAQRHHISVEYAGTAAGANVVSAVIDGAISAVIKSTSTGYTVETGKMVVGGQDTGSTRPLFGEICNLRLYSRALTAAEIAANYAIDKERFSLP